MTLETDNDAEREARIQRILRQLKEAQSRVDQLIEENKDHAAKIGREPDRGRGAGGQR